ncbi:MAG: filamentous hemagglutinin N-terminal domain-containing protein, partial [Rhizobiales bacterium]|nr:filamentous hemagglutinin N-terminal domain-containing protein [Hyphomicrobiales bacterium]
MIFRNKLSKYLLATVSAGAMMLNTSAFANPDGATIIVGDVDISGIGSDHVIIDSNTDRAIVDWNQFSIGLGETTTINQVSDDAAILNRVTGGNVTEIFGTLESNGQVYLINENGILVGESGVVETNGVVLSTLDVSNSDFLGAGDMLFSEGIDAGNGIEIHGKIRSVSGGDIFILSREITIGETGEIDANGGYVGLGAGQEILLKPVDSGEGRISIRAGKGKIVNRGTVQGVVAELKAAGGNEYALAINNSGVVRAKGYTKRGGKILLGGGGKVRNTGKLIARKKVVIRSKVMIENKGLVKAGNGDKGGEIIFEAPEIVVGNGSFLDVSGALGGGRAFIGGGYQGSAVDHDGNAVDISENATNVIIESGAVISADATVSGDAGDVVIWSDDSTVFAGSVSATAVDGVGGDAEISGKRSLNLAGFGVDLAGSQGGGTLLLDPDDITVSAAGGSNTATGVNVILDDDIEALLNAGTNVEIKTGGAGGSTTVVGYTGGAGGSGDINFEAGTRILWSENNDDNALFTVSAANDINALDDVIIQNSG